MFDCFCHQARTLACRIILLDERELVHEIQDNITGQALLDVVFRHLDLLETAYFGLRYIDQDNQAHWLESSKRLKRQLKPGGQHTFYFGVKFYASDPCKLLEEITRYQVFLQLKQDVLRGRLPVSFDLAAELAAFALQSELGDYDPRRHSPGYVSEFRLLANQTSELEMRAAEIHKTLKGVSPASAELSYLDKVKWLDMYGVDLHPVLGEDSVEYFLGLAPSGLLLLRGKLTVSNYYWPRISKLYYKGKYFMLKVADKNNDQSTFGFECPSRSACRHLWRCCNDHHSFFRMQQISPASAEIFVLGTRMRQSNKNERHHSRPRTPPSFTRTPSRRYARIQDSSMRDLSSKLDELRMKDVVEVKQPMSMQRPNSSTTIGGMYPTITENRYLSATINDLGYQQCNASDVRYQGGSSPRSTRSAPQGRGSRSGVVRRGLYAGSPPSARSVPNRPPIAPRGRSASVDSHSSNDSRSNRKHRHRSRRQSDAESELSRGSGRSGRRHRRHRSRHKHRDSGSEKDDRSASRPQSKEYELVDSGSQWREVQRQQAANGNPVQIASVRKSTQESEGSHRSSSHRHRRHRKHRSRSGSPTDKSWLTSELKQHLEFQLIDTEGMSEAQLREIPYTVVQSNRIRQAKLKSSRQNQKDSIPPSIQSPVIPQVHNKAYLDNLNANHGSIRSASSTISSARTGSEKHLSSRKSDHSLSNVLNGNVPYLISPLMSPLTKVPLSSRPSNNNSNSSSGELALSKLSHEHTDSGLGGDHDLAYSSERSSDSAKNQQVISNWDQNSARCASAASDTRLHARLHNSHNNYHNNLVSGELNDATDKNTQHNGKERKKSTAKGMTEMSTEL